jgi:hypothetical protein
MSLLTQASLVLTPNAYKANKLYSIIPSSGNGDMVTIRATDATRVNSSGLVENVATGIPRLDYTGSVPSILLEPQRTNLLTYSSTFTDSSWIKVSTTPVLDSTILSPDGTTNSYKISRASTSASSYISKASTSSTGTIYTFTVYAKLGDVSTNFGIRTTATYPNRGDALFNLSTGTLIGVANGGTNTSTSGNIQSVGNGWYRCSVTTTFAGTGINIQGLVSPTALTSIGGFEALDGALSNCYVWGGQLEIGSYATSYIPTTTATVTRATDSMTLNNLYANNLITSAGGTWFVEFVNNFSLIRDASGSFTLQTSQTSDDNGLVIKTFNDGGVASGLRIAKRISDVETTLYLTLTNTVKIAIDWNGTTADVFINGVKVVTATPFTTTNMNYFIASTTDVPKYIKSMILFPTALTDAEMITLTTL